MSQITKMRSSLAVARSLPKYVNLLAGSVSALKTTAQFSLTHPPSSKSFQNVTPHCRLLHPLFYFIYIFIPYTHTLVSGRITSRSKGLQPFPPTLPNTYLLHRPHLSNHERPRSTARTKTMIKIQLTALVHDPR